MNMWFPLFVNLENKKVLVIGGGKIAYKKITKILEYSANVTIVAEKIKEEKLLQLENVKIVDNKRIENDKDTIEELVKDYLSSKTEMNAMFGGIVKNDEFQIAISTGGKNCRRSRAMKSEIQKILDKIEK